MYTLEEYRDMLKKSFLNDVDERQLSDARKYFESSEAQNVIMKNYKQDTADLQRMKITDKVFRNSCVSGVAYCLYMMM